MVELLLQYGANVQWFLDNLKLNEPNGYEMASLLIKHGGDVNLMFNQILDRIVLQDSQDPRFLELLEDLLKNSATIRYAHLYKLYMTNHGHFRGPPLWKRGLSNSIIPFPPHLFQVHELLRTYKHQYRINETVARYGELFREEFEEAMQTKLR